MGFPRGQYPLKIEKTEFSLKQYQQFLADNQTNIDEFVQQRDAAFETELQHWIDSGQFHYESESVGHDIGEEEQTLEEGCVAIDSHVAGNLWQWKVKEGDHVNAGDVVCILESMKMEIDVTAPESGTIMSLNRQQGQQVNAGQPLLILKQD